MADPFSIDITEIDGFDNLHHAEGIILEAEKKAAQLYGSEETHFLVNGSTCGILAAVTAAVPCGGTILMARNSHKSAYHAVMVNRLHAEYLIPENLGGISGKIRAEEVERAFAGREEDAGKIRAVYITSPTYDGVVSDVKAIAEAAHRNGALLIVDEAHGAHFGMHPMFPESSVRLGADLVVHSVHKTLPSLTQTALLHVNGPLADRRAVRRMLDVYQTSSPSYVLMASIDSCVRMLEEEGDRLFEDLSRNLSAYYRAVSDLRYIRHIRTDDPSKILIKPDRSRMTAAGLYEELRTKYRLQPEMLSRDYVLMLSSVGDEREGFRRLADALHEIDARLGGMQAHGRQEDGEGLLCGPLPEQAMTIAEAAEAKTEKTPFERSAGRISGEFLYLYPPGIPLAAPGEIITEELIRAVCRLREEGFEFQGTEDSFLRTILTVRGQR